VILRNISSIAGVNVLKAVASVLVSFVVAHAVTPSIYGLVAFSIPLMTFTTLLTDLGLASAIVRHPDLTRAEAGAAVALMGLTGVGGGAVLALLARPLEHEFAMVGLAAVLSGYGAVTMLSIWAAAPRALLERKYAYTRIAAVETAALAAGLLCFAASLAASAGVMSLVIYQITFQFVRVACFLPLSRTLFDLNFRLGRIVSLMQVGGWVLVTNVMSYCARNLDNLLIGAFLGTASLGVYGLAYQFMTLPLVLITWPVSGILLSTLARLPAAAQSAKATVICAIMTGTAAVTFPMMAFLMVGSHFPLDTIYSTRWAGLATIVTMLAPVGAVQSIAAYGGAVLTEKGAVRLNFVLSTLNGGTLSAVFFTSVWFGLFALVVAYTVAAVLVSGIYIYFMCREAQIALRHFLACLMPGALAAGCAVLAVALVPGLPTRTLGQWLACVAVFAFVVLGVYGLLRRRLIASVRALTQSGGEIATVLQRA